MDYLSPTIYVYHHNVYLQHRYYISVTWISCIIDSVQDTYCDVHCFHHVIKLVCTRTQDSFSPVSLCSLTLACLSPRISPLLDSFMVRHLHMPLQHPTSPFLPTPSLALAHSPQATPRPSQHQKMGMIALSPPWCSASLRTDVYRVLALLKM